MTLTYIPGGASLYIDTALWAFRLTDGSLSLNNSAKRGITLQASIAWRPIAWPNKKIYFVFSLNFLKLMCKKLTTWSD